MSLQTGTRLAVTKNPLIDPSNLMIIAYEVDGPLLAERPVYLRIADVRELSNVGMIIDSNDEFIAPTDVVAIQKIIELNFNLVGLNVIDESRHKLGKVADYIVDTNGFFVCQINVRPSIIKSINSTELLIHRSQIVEISDTAITVKSAATKVKQISKPDKLTYVNPFRSSNQQVSGTDSK